MVEEQEKVKYYFESTIMDSMPLVPLVEHDVRQQIFDVKITKYRVKLYYVTVYNVHFSQP